MNQANSYFKYRPLYHTRPDGKREPHPFTKSIFELAEIYYAVPKNFNDPFDCNLRLHANGSTDAEWEDLFRSLAVQSAKESELWERGIREKWWKTIPEITEKFGKDHQERVYNNSSVFCLSRKGNSIPMFSYYADSHQGIAIQFNFEKTEIPCGYSQEKLLSPDRPYGQICVVYDDVDYLDVFPELNYHRLQGSTQIIKSLLFAKHKDWRHEEEFRICRHNVPAGKVQFDKRLLTGVVFGCKTTKSDMDIVRGWLQGWPSDVVLSKATQATDRYELKILDVETVKANA